MLFRRQSMSAVFGLRLADGTQVVVKAREDDGRAASCVAAQARLAEKGLPVAAPRTSVVGVGPLAVHAEELRGDSPDVAVRYAEVFAQMTAALADVAVAPPLPNPRWVRWDHPGPGPWPATRSLDERDQEPVPAHVVDVAARVRRRLRVAGSPRGRAFTADELQIAWAAGLWPAAHDVRRESLHGYTSVSGRALWTQAAERLRRADA